MICSYKCYICTIIIINIITIITMIINIAEEGCHIENNWLFYGTKHEHFEQVDPKINTRHSLTSSLTQTAYVHSSGPDEVLEKWIYSKTSL